MRGQLDRSVWPGSISVVPRLGAALSPGALAGLVFVAHAVAQVLARVGGLRFDMRPLVRFMQYLDPVLLQARLGESLFYLHSQPPLFNLFLGVVLKLPSSWQLPTFQAVYLLLSTATAVAVLMLQLRLGVGRPVAFLLSLAFAVSPALLLYSNWLAYSLPVAGLLCFSALCLHRFVAVGRGWAAFGFFSGVALVGLLRSSFHLVWFVVLAAGLLLAVPGLRMKTARAAVLPLLAVLALYAKNAAVFGKFSASSWLGMNAWEMAADQLPRKEVEQLVAAGELSATALIPRYADPPEYPAQYSAWSGPPAPALVQLKRSTGATNYNHIVYARVSDFYLGDALRLVVLRPAGYARSLLKAWFAYFKSSTDYVLFEPNRERLAVWNRLYDVAFCGRLPFDFTRTGWLKVTSPRGHFLCLFLLVGLPGLVAFGVRRALSQGRPLAERVTIGFLCLTIGYVAIVGNLLQAGENNRFRFETDPLSLVLLGLVAGQVLARRIPRTAD